MEKPVDRPVVASAGGNPIFSFIDPAGTLKLSKPRTRITLAQAGGKVFFAGGNDINVHGLISPGNPIVSGGGVSTVDIYDIASGTWSVAQLSEAAYEKAAVTVGKKVIFAGGNTMTIVNGKATEKICGAIDIYDLETQQWSAARLRVPRSHIAATVVGTKAYFAGGKIDGAVTASDVIDVYDAANGQWSELKLSKAMWGGAAVTKGTQAIFIGGAAAVPKGARDEPLNWVQAYETTTNKWTYDAIRYPKMGIQGVVVDTTVYLAGGDPFLVWPPSDAVEARYIELYPKPQNGNFLITIYGGGGRTRSGFTNVGNILVVAGGEDTISTVAVCKRPFTETYSMRIVGAGRFTSAVTVGNKVFIAGGLVTSTDPSRPRYPAFTYSDDVQILEAREATP